MNLTDFRNVLVLAPHTDDGELGAGGTIALLLEKDVNVHYVTFSTAGESVPAGMPPDILKKEVRAATKSLGIPGKNLVIYDYQVRKLNYSRQEILEDLIKLRSLISFDLVLMPSLNDIHQDHLTVSQEGLRAFKGTTILGYELIWNNLTFNTTCFVRLEKRHLENKIKALACYQSQAHRDYMTPEFIRAHARTRGVQIGAAYAEAFEVIRWVI
ncbi:MAG: PIG-L deacetylase family protein [Bacteroidales bacterium]|jgi:LmbE family N-acetylglucosaminyl deacetylase|nr:PIG-L deacetylase family protein [Bacteroidales bacterium]